MSGQGVYNPVFQSQAYQSIVAFLRPNKKPQAAPQTAAHTITQLILNDDPPTLLPELPSSRKVGQIQEMARNIPEAVEQAAMFYSMEQADAATSLLEAAIRTSDLGGYAQRAWGMLFELYQVQERRQDFDRLAAEYTSRFETSPPTWVTVAVDALEDMPEKNSLANKNSVVLSGVLNVQVAGVLQQIYKIAETSPLVQVETGKVTDVDDQGCGLLNVTLARLEMAHKECVIEGADRLALLVAKKTVPGERKNEQAWLLLLALYQQLGKEGAFDETAVNYAVTFEVSPPSFEEKRTTDPVARQKPESGNEIQIKDATCVLDGIITAASQNPFAAIHTEAMMAAEVIVDVSRLVRMDFVAATNLMNVATDLMASQKKLRLIKAGHLMTALWEVIGLDRVARIETRKI
jgi:anti-anti-sigma regulatory factor